VDARNALNALDDDGGEFARRELGAGRFEVVQRGEFHVGRPVERRTDGGVVRRGDGARRAAVEGFGEGQHFGAARLERRQLECVFVGLGARIAEEKAVVAVTRCAAKFFGQRGLKRVFDRIGVESQPGGLLRDRLHVVGLGVADRDDGVSAVKVEVLGACGVVDEAAFAAHRLDGVEGVYVE